MIGNDIVDLAQAKQESNWRRAGFLDKVFTDHEQQLIHTAIDPDGMVWLLWSMKESAYKLIVRQTGKRIFAPRKLVCHVEPTGSEMISGTVFYEQLYHTKSLITSHYVATVAFPASDSQTVDQIIIPFKNATYQTQHTVIQSVIKQHCATRFSLPETAVHIHKNAWGIPTLCIDTPLRAQLTLPVSISHHGHYGAYVIGQSATTVTI